MAAAVFKFNKLILVSKSAPNIFCSFFYQSIVPDGTGIQDINKLF